MRKKTNKQETVGLKELRENMEKYVREVKKGKSFTVRRRSQPVFRLSPIDTEEVEWETVADFTEIDPQGVSAREVLRPLRALDG